MKKNSNNISSEDLTFDQQHLWHPYTSLTEPLPVYPIQSAKGVHIRLDDGRELIDGMSSWWSVIHGYNHPELNATAKYQIDRMSHVMFGGITHQPAIDVGKKLVHLTPTGLDRVFLCDSGSVAVEVAMKTAVQYQQAKGNTQRLKFMTFSGGYHGDTTAAMSVCDPITGMHHLFKGFMPEHFFAPLPKRRFNESLTDTDIVELSNFFSNHAAECAAFILEPVFQGAGGMRDYSPDYLQLLRELCDEYDILLIADEIATGFGRTGKLFAVEHAEIIPDILCLGKALTGGYMTMAAMICTQKVATTVCSGEAGVLMHGPTFMGNPLACAVAAKSLELIQTTESLNRVNEIEHYLQNFLPSANKLPSVKEVRILGAIGVIETHQNINVAEAQKYLVAREVWVRPFKNLLYIMPPYIIEEHELKQLCEAMIEVLQLEEIYNKK